MLEILFWESSEGRSPIEKYVKHLEPIFIQRRVYDELELLAEYGLDLLRTKHLTKLGNYDDLYELRLSKGKIEERALLVIRGKRAVVVEIFRKKTMRIKANHLTIAIERIKDLERRGEL